MPPGDRPANTGERKRYRGRNPGPVQVGLYDLLGRRIAGPVVVRREAGVHKIDFDASQLAAGEYFVRVIRDGKWDGVIRVVRIH